MEALTKNPLINPVCAEEEFIMDGSLRPFKFIDYVGQEKVKNNLAIFIEAAKKRRGVLDHVLLYGPPGLGKTTLAYIIAKEMGVDIKVTSGPVIERPGDLAANYQLIYFRFVLNFLKIILNQVSSVEMLLAERGILQIQI